MDYEWIWAAAGTPFVRNLLAKSNILPENLPPEEDIKKLERRLENEDNKLVNAKEILPSSPNI